MRLSGYNVVPSPPCWRSLDHIPKCLYHKPHKPIMFPQKKVVKPKIFVHHVKGGENHRSQYVREHTGMKCIQMLI